MKRNTVILIIATFPTHYLCSYPDTLSSCTYAIAKTFEGVMSNSKGGDTNWLYTVSLEPVKLYEGRLPHISTTHLLLLLLLLSSTKSDKKAPIFKNQRKKRRQEEKEKKLTQ